MVDLTTGVFTPHGDMGLTLAGLGTYGGVIYGGAYGGHTLYSINTSTGALHGRRHQQHQFWRLWFHHDGAVRSWRGLELYSIDPMTGSATEIGPTGVSLSGVFGMSSGGDTLYISHDDNLYSLNTKTGAATLVGTATGPIGFGAEVSINGILYGGGFEGASTPKIYTLNSQNAAATFLSESPSTPSTSSVAGFWGLTPIPSPTPPTVTGITAQSDTGATDLNAGHTIRITVNTSAAVLVSGIPLLSLNNGATAEFKDGSGTSSLTFNYIVKAREDTPDLKVTGLTLPNGATI